MQQDKLLNALCILNYLSWNMKRMVFYDWISLLMYYKSATSWNGLIFEQKQSTLADKWQSLAITSIYLVPNKSVRYVDSQFLFNISKLYYFQRCQALKLIERCKPISSRSATIDEVLIKHTKEHYDVLKATSDSTDNEQLEDLSSRYDAVYIHPVSMICCFLKSHYYNSYTTDFSVYFRAVSVGRW